MVTKRVFWLGCLVGVAAIAACGDDDGPVTPAGDMGPRDMGRVDLGPGVDAGPECVGDGDCTGDQICVDNECVDPPAECTVDSDCDAGEICTPAGVCAPEPSECATDADCDPDGLTGGLFLCEDGVCGPADLSECPTAAIVERVCSIASVDSFCAEGLFVSCLDGASCEACDGECDNDTGCAVEPPPDMGPPPVDMGPPPSDMGPTDAGPPADMGPPPDDAGPRDAGPTDDAGPVSVCGNGIVETGEDCDGALAPTCTEAGCDTECNAIVIAPGCDNGCAEAGEACGEPGLPMCAGGSACVNCGCAVTCGNGVADAGEQCNEPGLTCGAGSTCNNATCMCVPLCGNGSLDSGETCDPPVAANCGSTTFCSPTCQIMPRPAMCGNGCIDTREECGEPGLGACDPDSRCLNCACVPNCGNGLIDPGETCDPPVPPPGGAQGCPATYCGPSCNIIPRPRICGNGCAEAGEECGDPGTTGCVGPATCQPNCECATTIRPRTTTTVTQSTPVTIVDTAVVTSTVVVPSVAGVIEDVNLTTFLTHTFAADLDITLTSPAGTVVTLTTDNGAGNDNVFNGTVWDDDANPTGQVPYVTNNGLATDHAYINLTTATPLAPEEPLGAFVGENPSGTWTITISDDLAGDTGSLASWSLAIVTTPAPTTTGVTMNVTMPLAIPTGPAVVSQSAAPGPGALPAGQIICDLNVRTFITHTFGADLDITLTSPTGTVVTLTTDNGAGNDNIFNGTVWDDDANPGGTVPYTTNNGVTTDHTYVNLTTATPLTPEEGLAALIGENPNGTWTITISDDLSGDGGSLDSWDLIFTLCNP